MRIRPSSVIACAVVAAVPLAFDPSGYYVFLPVKWTIATAAVFAGVAAVIVERGSVPRPPASLAWGALLGALVTSAVVGVGGLTSWIGYPGRYLGVLAWVTFFGAYLFGAAIGADRERTLVVASAASIVVSLYAIAQAFGIDPLSWSEAIDTTRTRSTLGNAAFLGAYLVLVVPLAARLAFEQRYRPVHIAAATLGLVALVTTQTRGAWIGATCGGALIAAMEVPRLRYRRRLIGIVAAAVVVMVGALATVSPYAARVRSVADPNSQTGRGRILQWERTLRLVEARPALGWGPETYASVFPRYIDARFERTVGREVIPDRAHNAFLDIAAASGLIGVAAFVAVIVAVALSFRRRDAIAVGLAGSCVAYVVQLQFGFPIAEVDVLFWLFAGLVVAPAARTLAIPRVAAVVAAAIAMLVLVWGLTDVVADRSLRGALERDGRVRGAPFRFQYLQAEARIRSRDADFAAALRAIDRAQQIAPRDLELRLDRADILLAWGESVSDESRIDAAARAYEKMLKDDPNSSRIELKRGVAYVELGREGDAERAWRRAAYLAPRSAAPLVNLGALYKSEGRTDEAGEAFRRALRIDPSNRTARAMLRTL
jgi:O-antigen ligase